MKTTNRFIQLILLIYFALLLLLISCTNKEMPVVAIQNNKINIVTTFYPLAEFTSQIAKDKVEVINLIPPGIEPHQWEPKPRDIEKIASADLFIYNGAGLETWINKTVVSNNREDKILEVSKGINLLDGSQHEHEHEKEDINPLQNDKIKYADPHIWLDPLNAIKIVENITDRLIMIDPNNKDYYLARSNAYKLKLKKLNQKFETEIKNFRSKDFVVSHASFGYLAKRYNLNQVAVSGLSPDSEPNLKDLKELIKLAEEKNIEYIFFETLVNPKTSQVLAQELGAKTLVLNPLEGLTSEETKLGKNYLSIMEENLENLSKALK